MLKRNRDVSYWSAKKRYAWIRREIRRSRHYAPALARMGAIWRNDRVLLNCRAGGGYITIEIGDSTMVVDAGLNTQELHDLWVIMSGLDHYWTLMFEQALLPMDHSK